MSLSHVPTRPGPKMVGMLVRVPTNDGGGCRFSGSVGTFTLSQILFSSIRCPLSCNFIPGALTSSNSPLSNVIVVSRPAFPNYIVTTHPVKVLRVVSNNSHSRGVLYIPISSPHCTGIGSLSSMTPRHLSRVTRFFHACGGLRGGIARVLN